ncbi:MAG: TIGR03546 family protein [Spirochaetaceae bacterium]|nr:TIGR03546 family protein [Spirochaetaceae bacterium]
MLKYFIKMLKALNANSHPGELAHAFAFGLLLGFLPKTSALWYIIFIISLFLRINKGFFFISIILGSLLAPLFDPLFDNIGYFVLTLPQLASLFRSWLDIPFVAFTRFNNSIVAGSLVFSIIAYIPFYILARLFVSLWRKTLQPLLVKNPIVKGFMKIPLVKNIAKAVQKAKLG